MSVKVCHVCGSNQLGAWCKGLLECGACSHVQANTELSDQELSDLYSHKYFQGEEYVDYALERDALNLNFSRRLQELQQLVPSGGHLFEIGCAYGYFLELARQHYIVSGCDISKHAIESALHSGLDVKCADYLSLPAPEKPYDIICMWDTIEHISKPRPYVEKAMAELRSGGCLVVSTGDAGSKVARIRRERWRMVHPPTHLHYFTSQSMKTMLDNAGFVPVTIRHVPFYRNLHSSLQKVGAISTNKIVSKLAKTAALSSITKKVNLPVNLFDIMTVYAWKP